MGNGSICHVVAPAQGTRHPRFGGAVQAAVTVAAPISEWAPTAAAAAATAVAPVTRLLMQQHLAAASAGLRMAAPDGGVVLARAPSLPPGHGLPDIHLSPSLFFFVTATAP